jgi:hypothetical protein
MLSSAVEVENYGVRVRVKGFYPASTYFDLHVSALYTREKFLKSSLVGAGPVKTDFSDPSGGHLELDLLKWTLRIAAESLEPDLL